MFATKVITVMATFLDNCHIYQLKQATFAYRFVWRSIKYFELIAVREITCVCTAKAENEDV